MFGGDSYNGSVNEFLRMMSDRGVQVVSAFNASKSECGNLSSQPESIETLGTPAVVKACAFVGKAGWSSISG